MTKGRELPINSKVRRRLFEDDGERPGEWKDEDWLSKVVKTEYIARNLKNEVILKGMKWNFDFEKEEALEGPIQWYKRREGEWVGMQPTGRTVNMRKRNRDPESAVKLTYENERRKKRKLSSHTAVKRRVFFNDSKVQAFANISATDDNLSNSMMEEILSDNEVIEHWNFDFENRVPLEGPVDWQRIGDDWVGNMPGCDSRIVLYPDSQADEVKTKEIDEYEVDDMMIEDEVADHVKDLLKIVTEQVRVVYGNRSKVREQPTIKTIVVGNDGSNNDLISEDQMEKSKDELTSDLEEQVIPKERLSDMIRRKNQATPRTEPNPSMPPARKCKGTKLQVSSEKAKRKISFD